MRNISLSWYRPLVGLLGLVWLSSALAAPSVLQVSVSEVSDEDAKTQVLTIEGKDFGAKQDAPPVLVDYASHAFEHGVYNSTNSELSGMVSMPTADSVSGAVWANSTDTVFYSTSGDKRHRNLKGFYFLKGGNAWFGGSVAYGGKSGWDTPVDNPQLYVSWWYKNKYNSTWYYRISSENQTGDFIPSERISIEGLGGGLYVGIDDRGLHNIVLDDGYGGASGLKGKKITGQSSGAVTYFPTEFIGNTDSGYLFAGSKLARIWDDPQGSAGIRSSVAVHDFYVSPSKDEYEMAVVYDNLRLPADEWVHLEYLLDTDKGVVKMYEDGRFRGEAFFNPDAIYSGKYSPTLSLIGTNGRLSNLQESAISEIYMDKSWQRVAIGNAAKISEVTHFELQRPLSWSDSEIKAALYLGALDSSKGGYLYVFDRDNNANENGIPVCDVVDCGSPPAPVSLSIE